MMEWLFESGHAVDIVLAVIALEAMWLRTRGWTARKLGGMLLPAIFILLGLRAALVGVDWWWIALPLAASLPVHLWDLSQRAQ